jgi:succinate dehydrogenase / fumarate reductase cytochrome b subunit
MLDERPRFLNLTKIKFPITAIASISQRISGVVLFLGIPVILYCLQLSLSSLADFNAVVECITQHLSVKLAIWIYILSLVYHVLGGVRHLIMDLGFLEELPIAKCTATGTFVLTVAIMIVVGVWLW